jgi:hypothetical protein
MIGCAFSFGSATASPIESLLNPNPIKAITL